MGIPYSFTSLLGHRANFTRVVVIAEKDPEALRTINAQMRRIDLLCKLLGPLFIALVDGYSSEMAIIINFAMNAASVIVEYFAIARIYWEVPELQRSKKKQQPSSQANPSQNSDALATRSYRGVMAIIRKSAADFVFYFKHHAFLPSFAGAMLYLTVLSFSGQMVTFLLSAGYNSMQIAIARTISVVFEVLATWLAPWLMGWIGAARAGLWFSSCQVLTLAAGFAVFWIFEGNPLISASGLVVGTILSRLGLWGLDLCIQFIVQEVCPLSTRLVLCLITIRPGSRGRKSRGLFLCRSCLAERLRTSLLRLDYNFQPPRPV